MSRLLIIFSYLFLALLNTLPLLGENERQGIELASFPAIPILSLDDLSSLEETDENYQYLYFVRHGESNFNVNNAQGFRVASGKSLSVDLTAKGQDQAFTLAKKLTNRLKNHQKVVILSSTALRAQHTARLLFEELSKTCLNLKLGSSYEGLCEMGLGDWEGKAKDQVFDQALHSWECLSAADKFNTLKTEGGESFEFVAARAIKDLKYLSKEYSDSTIIIVSHFHTLNALHLKLNGWVPLLSIQPSTFLPFLIFDNCDVLEIEHSYRENSFKVKAHIQAKV